MVSSTPRPHFTPGKDPVPIVQEAGWAPGPVWTGGKSRPPPGFDPRTVQPVAQSLYRLSSLVVPTELPGRYGVLTGKYLRFKESYCLRLQYGTINLPGILDSEEDPTVLPNVGKCCTSRHGVTSKKTQSLTE